MRQGQPSFDGLTWSLRTFRDEFSHYPGARRSQHENHPTLHDLETLFTQGEHALKGKAETRYIETILYVLWDLGLKIGHATRTISENIAAAKEDITICTSLIEIRFIAGSEVLGEKQLAAFKKWLSRQPVPE